MRSPVSHPRAFTPRPLPRHPGFLGSDRGDRSPYPNRGCPVTLFPPALRATAAALVGGGLLALGATAPATAQVVPAPPSLTADGAAFTLSTLGTFETGVYDASAAEIVTHFAAAQRLLVVNAAAAQVDVLSIADAAAPAKLFDLRLTGVVALDGRVIPAGAAVNSVAVRADGLGAIAVESNPKTDLGWVVFFDANESAGDTLGAVTVGALPDSLVFSPDGTRVIVANEGEPAEDYSVDPEGSVSIIDVPTGIALPAQSDVATADFRAFDAPGALEAAVRIFGGREDAAKGTPVYPVAENLEPEYATVSSDSTTAWVSLQEANAIAEVDLATATVTAVRPLGTISHLTQTPIDASDRDGGINIRSWPVQGFFMPDTIDSYDVAGETYLVTANEGDSRDWAGYSEVLRVKDLADDGPGAVCADAFADVYGVDGLPGDLAGFLDDDAIGRLNVTTANGFDQASGCFTELYSFGTRSFSIWTSDGTLAWDSADAFEQITAQASPDFFNSNHSESNLEGRSDDKGPEPEALVIGELDGRSYAFVGFERIGGVAAFDITDPTDATFVTYLNNRDFAVSGETDGFENAGDLGPESIVFISAGESPTGAPMLAVGNEVSGTTTTFSIDLAAAPVIPVVVPPGTETLAATGVSPAVAATAGGALLLAGLAAAVLGRREGRAER
ncbi:MAG: choice-of-anchor I family protein [Burkholderiaceae bacterium]|nr:choice-of-anchor I family protein [Microbacteriaceae bacterium]